MLKSGLLFLCLGFCTSLCAQEESFARYIKVSPADSLLPIKETVKIQLNKEMSNKKKQSQNNLMRLVLMGTDKENGITISRWLAAKQNKDLYRVNLSAVVSKYIGETEKNLELVFSRAAEKNCILLFDEADALFGQRSEANDADGSETNPGLAYFLKRIREYKGIIIITCTGNDCLATFAKQKFTGISSSLTVPSISPPASWSIFHFAQDRSSGRFPEL